LLACVAEFERDRIRERIVVNGKTEKHSKSGFLGGRKPFGYKVIGSGKDSMLEVDPAEQKAIRRIMQLRKKGMSFVKIAGELNAGLGMVTVRWPAERGNTAGHLHQSRVRGCKPESPKIP